MILTLFTENFIFDYLDNIGNEPLQWVLKLVLPLIAFVLIINLLHYVIHKIRFSIYKSRRMKIYKKAERTHKVKRVKKALNKVDSYQKLKKRHKKHIDNYAKFIIKDIKYNVNAKHYKFGSAKSVQPKVIYEGDLGHYSGSPKKVYRKLCKRSKKYTGFLDALNLFEAIGIKHRIYGLSTKEATIVLKYTLRWVDSSKV